MTEARARAPGCYQCRGKVDQDCRVLLDIHLQSTVSWNLSCLGNTQSNRQWVLPRSATVQRVIGGHFSATYAYMLSIIEHKAGFHSSKVSCVVRGAVRESIHR